MTETEFSSKVASTLRDWGCKTFKHTDMFGTGIPDLSSTKYNNTWWFEVKQVKEDQKIFDRILKDKVQFANMCELAVLGKAAYLVRVDDRDRLWIIPPRLVRTAMPKIFSELQPRVQLYDEWDHIIDCPIRGQKFEQVIKLMRLR